MPHLRGKISTAWENLRVWEEKRKSKLRPPLPLPIWGLMVGLARGHAAVTHCEKKKTEWFMVALFLELGLLCLLRPGELLRLKGTDFALPDAGPQQWRGCISVAFSSVAQLEEAAERLRQLKRQAWERLRCTRCLEAEAAAAASSGRPACDLPRVPMGTAARATQFYKEARTAAASEVEGCSGAELGEHMAIYVADFEGCFQRLLDRGGSSHPSPAMGSSEPIANSYLVWSGDVAMGQY
eukprot:Skav220215  [mRNA]  locus=scaffold1600:84603:99730:- [translate_table: standard]